MLELKTPKERASHAMNLAQSFQLVTHHGILYMPADFEDRTFMNGVVPERTVWIPVTANDLQQLSKKLYKMLFSSEKELVAFEFMVHQGATTPDKVLDEILVNTKSGLRRLDPEGVLQPASGVFVPNYIQVPLSDDQAVKDEVLQVIVDWVGGEDEAHSLLYHLATTLSPGYSAVKYVLLLGGGRNGKGVLLKMLHSLFSAGNMSSISRQYMSDASPACFDLNGKLLNLVFDGPSTYIKDSGPEKTLVAGEPLTIRKLFSSQGSTVQTNALFVEALNNEPKSKDKSPALQKRLMRYQFSKVFALDKTFERKMLSEKYLGAFLSLLIDHFVREPEIAEKLAPTSSAEDLQVEYQMHNSIALQYIEHLELHSNMFPQGIIGIEFSEVAATFRAWRVAMGDNTSWTDGELLNLFKDSVTTTRKSISTPRGPRKVRVIDGYTRDAEELCARLKENEENAAELLGSLVED